MGTDKRGRPRLPIDPQSIQLQHFKADLPVLRFIRSRMEKRGQGGLDGAPDGTDVETAARRFHKSERTIQRILERWSGGRLGGWVTASEISPMQAMHAEFQVALAADLKRIDAWLTSEECTAFRDVPADIVRRIVRDREELARLRARFRPKSRDKKIAK